MVQTRRGAKMDTVAARKKLTPRGEPYSHWVNKSLTLRFRRLHRGGTWSARIRIDGDYLAPVPLGLAPAESDKEADGVKVLSFAEAVEMARLEQTKAERIARGLPGEDRPYSVGDAWRAYLPRIGRGLGKSRETAVSYYKNRIEPTFGAVALADLTTEKLQAWYDALALSPPLVRSAKGLRPRFNGNHDPGDPVQAKRRRESAQRVWSGVLKPLLNLAFTAGHVDSDQAWRRVRTFDTTAEARIRFLEIDECRRLHNAAEGAFRDLIDAALLTGCRYGELRALNTGDFDREHHTVFIADSKSGKSRYVYLTDEGVAFFDRHAAGQPHNRPLLRRDDGTRWDRSHQLRPMREACERAGIDPPVGFHILRHTFASLAVKAGASLPAISRQLGHADTRVTEAHYMHLAPDFLAREIQRAAPRLGIEPGNVEQLRRG